VCCGGNNLLSTSANPSTDQVFACRAFSSFNMDVGDVSQLTTKQKDAIGEKAQKLFQDFLEM